MVVEPGKEWDLWWKAGEDGRWGDDAPLRSARSPGAGEGQVSRQLEEGLAHTLFGALRGQGRAAGGALGHFQRHWSSAPRAAANSHCLQIARGPIWIMTVERLRSLPFWQGEIRAEPLAGGLSNVSWKVTDRAGAHVVRFGTDYPFHHIDREREVIAARAAHEGGFGPAVEYSAPGVMVSAFLEARTWSAADVAANPERVGTLLRAFHRDMPARIAGPGYIFWVFHVIRDYARQLCRHGPRRQSCRGILRSAPNSRRRRFRCRSSSAITTCCPPTSSTMARGCG